MNKKKAKKGKHQSNKPSAKNAPNPGSQSSGSSKSPGAALTPKSFFTVTIKMLSDWHIGSGAGRTGDVDRLVQRDKDDLPYIPAKTLTGIWRDACELVAWGLDNGQLEDGRDRPSWQKWVNYLFGDQPALAQGVRENKPREAALSIRSAHLPEPLIKALNEKPNLKEFITFIKPGIAIDPKSGCAKEDYLRFEEMVRSGAELKAACELHLPTESEQQKAAYALLLAGAKIIERLGGKRRRGAGQCQVTVENNIAPWINWIEANPTPPPIPPTLEEGAILIAGQPIAEDAWVNLKLKITAKSPVIIRTRTVGNVVETLDYIPGTYLLRLIHRRLGNLSPEFNRAIAHGDIIVTNATVEINEAPGRPVPLALFSEKLGGGLDKGKVYNRLREPEPANQLKGERAGYIGSLNGFLPEFKKVDLTVATHNIVEDDRQCPTKDIGGVYSYQAIEPGTILQAELRLRQGLITLNKQNSSWWTGLQSDYRIGQSKKDDYGLVSVEVLEKPSSVSQTLKIEGSELVVWLLSDVLIRDERLRPTTSIKDFAKQLGDMLGVTLTEKEAKNNTLSLVIRQHRIDSWQVRWGLPRPSLVGLKAGSCIVFTVDRSINSQRLAQVQASGIGERRAEGYGQLCFNDPVLTSDISKLTINEKVNQSTKSNHSSLIPKSDRSFDYARIIEEAAWRETLRRAALRVASNKHSRKVELGIDPQVQTNSQLGSLRSLIATLKVDRNNGRIIYHTEQVIRWLDNLTAKDKWTQQSRDQIRVLVNTPDQIWNILQLPFSKLILTQTGEQDLKAELWSEAVHTLIDACIRAHTRENESRPEQTLVVGGVEHGA